MNVIILLKNFELELVKESFVEVGENFSYFFFYLVGGLLNLCKEMGFRFEVVFCYFV